MSEFAQQPEASELPPPITYNVGNELMGVFLQLYSQLKVNPLDEDQVMGVARITPEAIALTRQYNENNKQATPA